MKLWSFCVLLASAPLSIVDHLAIWIIQYSFSVKIVATEFTLILLPRSIEEGAPAVFFKLVSVSEVRVSIGVCDLGLADQHSFHPLSLKLLPIRKNQQPPTTELPDPQVSHFGHHREAASLGQLEHLAVLQAVILLLEGREGVGGVFVALLGESSGRSLPPESLECRDGGAWRRRERPGGVEERSTNWLCGWVVGYGLQALDSEGSEAQLVHPVAQLALLLVHPAVLAFVAALQHFSLIINRRHSSSVIAPNRLILALLCPFQQIPRGEDGPGTSIAGVDFGDRRICVGPEYN